MADRARDSDTRISSTDLRSFIGEAEEALVAHAVEHDLRDQKVENYAESYNKRTIGVTRAVFYTAILDVMRGTPEHLDQLLDTAPQYAGRWTDTLTTERHRVMTALQNTGAEIVWRQVSRLAEAEANLARYAAGSLAQHRSVAWGRYFAFNPNTGTLAPSKFVGIFDMTFERYGDRTLTDQSAFDGGSTQRALRGLSTEINGAMALAALRQQAERLGKGLPEQPEIFVLGRTALQAAMGADHAPPAAPAYTLDDALTELFLDRKKAEQIIASLHRKKNIILEGPPGVGKSFMARRLAYVLAGAKDPSRVEMVQFHQSYAYEDFIQGFRPNEQGTFERRDGVFYSFCARARANPSKPHVFVIDEINRGNLSKIFGELMLLVEADKRGPEFSMPLTYSRGLDDRFFVPDNLFIIGLMNTADRSLAMVDYALRRRFVFHAIAPEFDSPRFAAHLEAHGVSSALRDRLKTRLNELNVRISDDRKNLGPGFAIGHSYFCPTGPGTYDDAWYEDIIHTEITPLLDEYWFDDLDTASGHAQDLLRP